MNRLRDTTGRFRSSWSGYQSTKNSVQRECAGHRYVWVSGVRQIFSKHELPSCKNAVGGARTKLKSLQGQYNAIGSQARRDGVDAADLRTVLSEYGLADFTQTSFQEEQYLYRMENGLDN